MKKTFHALLLACACAAPFVAPARAASVARVDAPTMEGLAPAHFAIGGRVATTPGSGGWTWQWPGLYFETAFAGGEAVFEVGAGATILHVEVDGRTAATLARPAPGLYRVSGLAGNRPHILRIQAATENQAGPNHFGGIFLPAGSQRLPPPLRERRIEFIGDSHTVGYGNLSPRRECSEAEVWATTDNTRAYGPLLAARYGADYRINAISGRGVVRNYGGMAADTLPQAYPYALFDRSERAGDEGWHPQVVVIALGTNDFSTPLAAGERWKDRQALYSDYERAYVAFVRSLRDRYPAARFVLWSTDLFGGEIRAEVERVVARLNADGDVPVTYLPVAGLQMSGCHGHPSLDDHARIAELLAAHIETLADRWDE
ncbi:GDSL-type esterase/lipase family protein [Pseudoxanthomonas daejeonensis]|uniref:SGNH/GDSL hydrolase family protein n=1 Tax=Pseudoxanthomonas daejeonensis TaxID=266062 RepID=UPI001F53F31F|nr:SGNH/GDSL hydrolase family protein [Pseudoxanthomonas daejeonensis]UNK57474.1 GDSL-type esterase/lipase family protein [Pseudoxanthomonas daejeonensis]